MIAALSVVVLLTVSYTIYGIIYRLYLTPLAHIPGPPLAKVTFWYEFYYDCVLKGRYGWKIIELHKKYGPIIRISPVEVHVADPEFYNTLYKPSAASVKIDKTPSNANAFGNPRSMFSTVAHDHHRMRRGILNPYFSKSAIMELEPSITRNIDKVVAHIRSAKGEQSVINLSQLYAAFTGDVIGDYCFGETLGLLDEPKSMKDWRNIWVSMSMLTPWVRQFVVIQQAVRILPLPVAERLDNRFRLINRFISSLTTRIGATRDKNDAISFESGSKTMLQQLLSDEVPEHERSTSRIVDEVQTFLGAGSLTTADILAALSYHILADQSILDQLQDELRPVLLKYAGGQPRLYDLERLSFLTALIKETLRIDYGIVGRLSRIHPDSDLHYNSYHIPKGTPTCMDALTMHNDVSVFGSDVANFNPHRWLSCDAQQTSKMDSRIVSFGKGTRSCLGINLAWAEIYLVAAAVFAPREDEAFSMSLYQTTEDDVKTEHDFVVPFPRTSSQGVQVVVR